MLIGGQPVDSQNYNEVLRALDALPPAVTNRYRDPLKKPEASDKVQFHYDIAAEALNDWCMLQSDPLASMLGQFMQAAGPFDEADLQPLIKEAMDHFKIAADLAEKEGSLHMQANCLCNYGISCRFAGFSEQSIPHLEKAALLCEEVGSVDDQYITQGELYLSLRDAVNQRRQEGKYQEAAELTKRMSVLGSQALEFLPRYKGERDDPDAYRVEQGEIGISDKERIGTDNVSSCVCLMIRDPETCETAVVHVDFHSDMSTLQTVLDEIPDDRTLEIKMLGSRHAIGNNQADRMDETSDENIQEIVRFFADKNVDFVACTIFDPGQSTAVVVDPVTYETSEAVPGIANPNKKDSIGYTYVVGFGRSKPQHFALDLRSSNERAPYLLNEDTIWALKDRYLGQEREDLYPWLKMSSGLSAAQLPGTTEAIYQTCEDYMQAVQEMTDLLKRTVEALEKKGVVIASWDVDEAITIIQQSAIHIGKNAGIANGSLADFVENRLFVAASEGSYNEDIEGLKSFTFPARPIDTIRAHFSGDMAEVDRSVCVSAENADEYRPEVG